MSYLYRPAERVIRPGRPPDQEIVIASAAFSQTDLDWTPPSDTVDYWQNLGASEWLAGAVDLPVGKMIKAIKLRFYRATASNPAIRLQSATTGAAAAEIAPTVAWTAPSATGSWGQLVASYDHVIVDANYQLMIRADGIGCRVRNALVTVGDP